MCWRIEAVKWKNDNKKGLQHTQLRSEEPSKKKLEIKLVYDQNIWSVYSSLVKNTGWFVGDGRSKTRNIKWNNKSTKSCVTNNMYCNNLITKKIEYQRLTKTRIWLQNITHYIGMLFTEKRTVN